MLLTLNLQYMYCLFCAFSYKPHVTFSWISPLPTVSMKMRVWIRSRRLNVSVREGWLTTPVSGWGCETSTGPSRSWAACANSTWRARSPKLNCSSSIRLWLSSSAWSSKSGVSVQPAHALSQHQKADPSTALNVSSMFLHLVICVSRPQSLISCPHELTERNLNPKAACLKRREEEKLSGGSGDAHQGHTGGHPGLSDASNPMGHLWGADR